MFYFICHQFSSPHTHTDYFSLLRYIRLPWGRFKVSHFVNTINRRSREIYRETYTPTHIHTHWFMKSARKKESKIKCCHFNQLKAELSSVNLLFYFTKALHCPISIHRLHVRWIDLSYHQSSLCFSFFYFFSLSFSLRLCYSRYIVHHFVPGNGFFFHCDALTHFMSSIVPPLILF